MKKQKDIIIETNSQEVEAIKEFIETHKDMANETAHDIAESMGYESAADLVADVQEKGQSPNYFLNSKAAHIGGEFAAKLSSQMFDQIIYTNYASDNLLSWHTKFYGRSVDHGARIGFIDNITTGCTIYDLSKYIPDSFTNSLIDTFEGSFLKADKSDSDTSYRFKKNKSVNVENWLPFFLGGKVNQVVAAILADLAKGFSFFITERYQSMIASLADGTAQTTIANAGENGKNLKLKLHNGTGKNTYESLIELNNLLVDLTQDFNKSTLATDSRSLYCPKLSDLIIFIPKKLKAVVESGILARLPNAASTNFSSLLTGDNVITVSRKIKPMQWVNNQSPNTTGNEAAIDIEDAPFLTEDKIVVIEKRAIHHFSYTHINGLAYYPENIVYEHVQHAWGFTVTLPFAKGFVYKNSNLLTYAF